jgi:hypothetical protein
MVWRLVRELAKVIDPARPKCDHQLVSMKIVLNTAEGHQGELEERASDAEARLRVEDDEF